MLMQTNWSPPLALRLVLQSMKGKAGLLEYLLWSQESELATLAAIALLSQLKWGMLSPSYFC